MGSTLPTLTRQLSSQKTTFLKTCFDTFTVTRVWKGVLGIQDLNEVQCRIWENAKILDRIQDLTATWEACSAKILAWDAVLGKKAVCGVDTFVRQKFGMRDCR